MVPVDPSTRSDQLALRKTEDGVYIQYATLCVQSVHIQIIIVNHIVLAGGRDVFLRFQTCGCWGNLISSRTLLRWCYVLPLKVQREYSVLLQGNGSYGADSWVSDGTTGRRTDDIEQEI